MSDNILCSECYLNCPHEKTECKFFHSADEVLKKAKPKVVGGGKVISIDRRMSKKERKIRARSSF